MEPGPASNTASEDQEQVTTTPPSPNINPIPNERIPTLHDRSCISCKNRHKRCSREGMVCGTCKVDGKDCVWVPESEIRTGQSPSLARVLVVPHMKEWISRKEIRADGGRISGSLEKTDEREEQSTTELIGNSPSRDIPADTTIEEAPEGASQAYHNSQSNASQSFDVEVLRTVGTEDDTVSDKLPNAGSNMSEHTMIDRIKEQGKQNMPMPTKRGAAVLPTPQIQPSSTQASIPTLTPPTSVQDLPLPAPSLLPQPPATPAGPQPPPPPPRLTCRYCPRRFNTLRGKQQHEERWCQRRPRGSMTMAPPSSGIGNDAGAALGESGNENSPGIIDSTVSTSANAAATAIMRLPPTTVLHGSASELSLPLSLPSAAALPSVSTAAFPALPLPPSTISNIQRRTSDYLRSALLQPSSVPPRRNIQHEWETNVRAADSQPQVPTQVPPQVPLQARPRAGRVQDLAGFPPLTRPILHPILHRRRQTQPRIRGSIWGRGGLRAHPRPSQIHCPTPLSETLAQSQPLIHGTLTTPTGHVFPLSALSAQIDTVAATAQAEEEARICRENDLALPGRLAELRRLYALDREIVGEEVLGDGGEEIGGDRVEKVPSKGSDEEHELREMLIGGENDRHETLRTGSSEEVELEGRLVGQDDLHETIRSEDDETGAIDFTERHV